jgi:hypothetical protein
VSDPIVIAELKRLAEERGGLLRPSEIVEAASERESVLHKFFQWDDSEAARQYRISQARQLLRVTVQYVGAGDEPISARVFISLKSDRKEEGGGYRVTAHVMLNEKQRAQLFEQALDDIRYFKKKYASLQELSGVLSAMEAAQQAFTKAA